MKEPSKRDWAALYQAAIAFKETAPWEWMDNEELFAVENPHDGEAGYCSILGSGGEEFGLGTLLGEEGYDRYTELITGETDPEDFEANMMMRSLSLLLVDRDILRKEDYAVIRSLGLRFRGKNAWPLFRSQRPGYVPWFLEKGELLFLTAAIQQALVVADEVRSGKLDLCEGEADGLVLTRCYSGGDWLEEWRKAGKSDQGREFGTEGIDPVKEAQLYLLRDRAGKLGGSWELDIFMLPVPIRSGSDRPHYPSCFLAVETKLGLIVDTNLTSPWLTLPEKQDEIIRILSRSKQLPREIHVESDKVRRVVEPITRILGMKLRVCSLPMLEQAKASLQEHFLEY